MVDFSPVPTRFHRGAAPEDHLPPRRGQRAAPRERPAAPGGCPWGFRWGFPLTYINGNSRILKWRYCTI